MPRPDLPDAPVSEYEEIWRTLDPRVGPEGHNARVSWILESVDSSLDRENGKVVKTFLGRVGGTFLVLRQTQFHARSHGGEVSKTGSEVSARREEWEEGSGWIAKYVVGDDAGSLPSMCAGLGGEDEGSWKEGGKARLGETGYVVRALERV